MRKDKHKWFTKLSLVLSLLVFTGLVSYTVFSLADNHLLSEYKDLRTDSSETNIDQEEEDAENDPDSISHSEILLNYSGFDFNGYNWHFIYADVKTRRVERSFKLSLFILLKVIRL